jgi:hypothetical protein
VDVSQTPEDALRSERGKVYDLKEQLRQMQLAVEAGAYTRSR